MNRPPEAGNPGAGCLLTVVVGAALWLAVLWQLAGRPGI